MDDQSRISRRSFIAVSVLSAASPGCWIGCSRFQPAVVLSAGEFRLVQALADQIIPPDEAPGGEAAGVAEFIERQLCGPYRRHLADYREGLGKIDQMARRLHARSFVDLAPPSQLALLEAIETDQVPDDIWKPTEPSQFFRLVCDHCMQGFYGSPRHGGNRSHASWRMIGLEYPQIVGRVVIP